MSEVENNEPENHVADIVNNMYAGDIDAMKTSFELAMGDKVVDVLADRRLELAATMFQPTQEEPTEE